MARSGRYGVVAAVSALLLLGTAGPALALPSVGHANGAAASPTVDVSTADDGEPGFSVSSSVLWWSGGGLGVALAGLVAARQPTTRR